MAEKNSEIGAC